MDIETSSSKLQASVFAVLSCSVPQRDGLCWAAVGTGLGKSALGGLASSFLLAEHLPFGPLQLTKGGDVKVCQERWRNPLGFLQ